MPTYINLLNWTDEGIRGFKGALDRAQAARELAERLGGTVKADYWTIGPYDVVAVTEFPDDETSTAFLLAIGAQGNVRTTTLRAFDHDEMERVIAKAG
jgi:uncharacterized protein with GYD domain